MDLTVPLSNLPFASTAKTWQILQYQESYTEVTYYFISYPVSSVQVEGQQWPERYNSGSKQKFRGTRADKLKICWFGSESTGLQRRIWRPFGQQKVWPYITGESCSHLWSCYTLVLESHAFVAGSIKPNRAIQTILLMCFKPDLLLIALKYLYLWSPTEVCFLAARRLANLFFQELSPHQQQLKQQAEEAELQRLFPIAER